MGKEDEAVEDMNMSLERRGEMEPRVGQSRLKCCILTSEYQVFRKKSLKSDSIKFRALRFNFNVLLRYRLVFEIDFGSKSNDTFIFTE